MFANLFFFYYRLTQSQGLITAPPINAEFTRRFEGVETIKKSAGPRPETQSGGFGYKIVSGDFLAPQRNKLFVSPAQSQVKMKRKPRR